MSDSEFLIYNKGQDPIVDQWKDTIYHHKGEQALYKMVDVHLEGYEWVPIGKWDNHGDKPITYKSELKITQGDSVEERWGFKLAFRGLQFNIGGNKQRFSREETTTSNEYTVTVPADLKLPAYVYQKRYKFKAQLWFLLDDRNQVWTVGEYKKPGVLSEDGVVEINSDECVVKPLPLSGEGSIDVAHAEHIRKQDNIKQFDECPSRCQNFLVYQGE